MTKQSISDIFWKILGAAIFIPLAILATVFFLGKLAGLVLLPFIALLRLAL